MTYTLDRSFVAATVAIVLGAVAGIITAMYPSDANAWVPAVVAGITAFASLLRRQFHLDDADA